MQYEHELYFQSYHNDDLYNYFQQQPLPFIEDLSVHNLLADSCTETVAKPLNCTDNVIITSNHVLEGVDEGGGGEGRGGNKGEDVMSCRNSFIRGRISKNNKRSSNKDRHSKINTARGPRDRRMRLSLDAARKFFHLQDLLGFDKASKTVEWLLNKSKPAIEELTGKGNEGPRHPDANKQISGSTTTGIGAICASNSISESCEVISGTDETSSSDKNKETAKEEKRKKKKKTASTARRAELEPPTKESRNQARARARERTKTKKMSQIGKSKALAHDLNPSRSRRPINEVCEEPGTHEQLSFHQENNVDESNLVVNGNWNPFSIFSYN